MNEEQLRRRLQAVLANRSPQQPRAQLRKAITLPAQRKSSVIKPSELRAAILEIDQQLVTISADSNPIRRSLRKDALIAEKRAAEILLRQVSA